jgi:hypothetical protein
MNLHRAAAVCFRPVRAADLIDDGPIKSLTESGFVDKIFDIYKVTGK